MERSGTPRLALPARTSVIGEASPFLIDRRRREQGHVDKAVGDLRQSLWTFTHELGSVLIDDRRMDTRLTSQLDRLKAALERPSTEELKQEVVSSVSSLSQLVVERRRPSGSGSMTSARA